MWPDWQWLRRWEGLLLVLLVAVVALNIGLSPFYLGLSNQINLFQLSIEKLIVALVMALVIINAEIDLSVASVMGLAACVLAYLHEQGTPLYLAILVALVTGVLCGAFNGFWIAYVRLPSLAVTLAGLVGYRGVARILLEDRSIGGFPDWFDALGQRPLLGPLPLSLLLFGLFLVVAVIVLQYSAFGRYVYIIGNNQEVARYSGVKLKQVKMVLFIASGTVAALAGLLLAARLGAVRGNTAEGFELDIITMVLLGGVSIFGGSGTLTGVILAILIILNLRNGMSLANFSGNVQTGVTGALLILSVLLPNLVQAGRARWKYRRAAGGT
ncbi:MAG: ABC transporter permease [Chloroflexi bacterium]|nr:ABC transporter permease [Chloroflexota bacterium]MCI0576171.1 ABC transporter permease [Chloroflexota bacterium]MCI0648976.1 ABC transporter permease [Chloroflexota bacterium]MCI0728192.1 ABC transporter permease [Chloroflexota bacterium]